MGAAQAKATVVTPQPVVEERLKLRELPNFYAKWKRQPGNEDRDLILTAENEVTGAIERARFVSMYGVDYAIVRWGRYLFEEPRFVTQAVCWLINCFVTCPIKC